MKALHEFAMRAPDFELVGVFRDSQNLMRLPREGKPSKQESKLILLAILVCPTGVALGLSGRGGFSKTSLSKL
jgi:hypothetical protein